MRDGRARAAVFVALLAGCAAHTPRSNSPGVTARAASASDGGAPDAVDSRAAVISTPARPDRDGDGVADEDDCCPDVSAQSRGECGAVAAVDSVPLGLNFRPGRAERDDTDYELVLESVLHRMRDVPEILRVEVRGHADPTERNGEALSLARAEWALAWLVAHGVAPQRLVARGVGATMPIADNRSEAGRRRNRRVEWIVVELDDKALRCRRCNPPGCPRSPCCDED